MKKKIIIFTSSGGGGHESATRGIISYLQDEYDIIPVYIFADALKSIDLIKTITFGHITAEQAYNYFMRKKWNRAANFLFYSISSYYLRCVEKKIQKDMLAYLKKMHPDFIISVIPFVNNAILDAAQQLNIPFLLIPTDLDATTFISGLYKPTYQKFHMILAFDDMDIKQSIAQPQIPEAHISVEGFPLRVDFFTPKDIHHIKKMYDIPQEKPVILMLMGAAGSQGSYHFIEQIATIKLPLHIIVVLGKNEQLRSIISAVKLPENMSITIIGFTDHIADLMAIADLCITKSGSVSFCEAIYSNLPILLDATTGILRWEQFNHQFMEKHHFGYSISSYDELPQLIINLLNNPEQLDQIKKNLEQFPKKQLEKSIKKIILDLLNT